MKESDIKGLVRKNIASLAPYSTARDEYGGKLGVFLDANESPYENGFNRYPDPRQKELKGLISQIKGIPAENIFIGNGSDEAIDLVFRIFCTPGKDKVVGISPSYGMYSVAAEINDVQYIPVQLNEDFSLPLEKLLEKAQGCKVIFICSPNNPTGNAFPKREIIAIAERFKGVVVVDEAYIDFSSEESMIGEIVSHPNIIVLQTLSKAWGMAGLRLGLAFATPYIMELFSQVKYPYNVNVASMKMAAGILQNGIADQTAEIIGERESLAQKLAKLDIVEKVYPSDANFLLVKFNDPNTVYGYLIEKGIIVRNRNTVPGCAGCLRISVGRKNENDLLLKALEGYGSPDGVEIDVPEPGRVAKISRKTAETSIEVELNLDGGEDSQIDTGLKFFDHMLYQIVHHAGVKLNIRCKGDLEVDEHHTMEDVAIVLGEAIYTALGNKRGIERYGFALPMDECRALVLLDFGGRADFQWDVQFTREMVGDVPTEMFKHFFKTLCIAMKANLHIQAKGENNHHLIEGVFKAFARSIKMAIRRDPFKYTLPSSKGII
ncbi:MAG: histidinol-phosphate transaminase [Bacteroidales bacterium]|nr:histidinol-phosphate transaminase [Bacteroidales bacterium]